MERRAIPRKAVLMPGAIQFAGCAINCLVRDMSISGAALEVAEPHDVPQRFNLVFKTDGTRISCHVVWRQEERIGVAFDQSSTLACDIADWHETDLAGLAGDFRSQGQKGSRISRPARSVDDPERTWLCMREETADDITY